MGVKLTRYDHNLRRRIETIRKDVGLEQWDMADLMGVTIESYKRYIYGRAKIPAEALAALSRNLPVDADYLLKGRQNQHRHLMTYFLNCKDGEKADFFRELAKLFDKRDNVRPVDYSTDEGHLIEMKDNKNHR